MASESTVVMREKLRASADQMSMLFPNPKLEKSLAAAVEALCDILRHGGIIWTVGNGGSAAQAMHFTEELVGKFRNPRPPLRSVCLNADPTVMSCIANDFGWDNVFTRQASGLAHRHDAVLLFSTSGLSRNQIRLAEDGADEGPITIAMLGPDLGELGKHCDLVIHAPGRSSDVVQEMHTVLLHTLIVGIEEEQPWLKSA